MERALISPFKHHGADLLLKMLLCAHQWKHWGFFFLAVQIHTYPALLYFTFHTWLTPTTSFTPSSKAPAPTLGSLLCIVIQQLAVSNNAENALISTSVRHYNASNCLFVSVHCVIVIAKVSNYYIEGIDGCALAGNPVSHLDCAQCVNMAL